MFERRARQDWQRTVIGLATLGLVLGKGTAGWAVSAATPKSVAIVGSVGLEEGFARPPAETKPWCYYYWLSGHISKEGITKDLEAMAKWGIGRAFIADISTPGISRGPVGALGSDEFSEMLQHAIREGGAPGRGCHTIQLCGLEPDGGCLD
ncbi:MAG: glycosyl hydrolase [bacterium]